MDGRDDVRPFEELHDYHGAGLIRVVLRVVEVLVRRDFLRRLFVGVPGTNFEEVGRLVEDFLGDFFFFEAGDVEVGDEVVGGDLDLCDAGLP